MVFYLDSRGILSDVSLLLAKVACLLSLIYPIRGFRFRADDPKGLRRSLLLARFSWADYFYWTRHATKHHWPRILDFFTLVLCLAKYFDLYPCVFGKVEILLGLWRLVGKTVLEVLVGCRVLVGFRRLESSLLQVRFKTGENIF